MPPVSLPRCRRQNRPRTQSSPRSPRRLHPAPGPAPPSSPRPPPAYPFRRRRRPLVPVSRPSCPCRRSPAAADGEAMGVGRRTRQGQAESEHMMATLSLPLSLSLLKSVFLYFGPIYLLTYLPTLLYLSLTTCISFSVVSVVRPNISRPRLSKISRATYAYACSVTPAHLIAITVGVLLLSPLSGAGSLPPLRLRLLHVLLPLLEVRRVVLRHPPCSPQKNQSTDRQIDRQAGKQTSRQAGRQAGRRAGGQTCRKTKRTKECCVKRNKSAATIVDSAGDFLV